MIPSHKDPRDKENSNPAKGDRCRMDAFEAQTAYHSIRVRFDTGQISIDDYNLKVRELRYQDNTGIWWTISPADGSWLRWNGTSWEPAFAHREPVSGGINPAHHNENDRNLHGTSRSPAKHPYRFRHHHHLGKRTPWNQKVRIRQMSDNYGRKGRCLRSGASHAGRWHLSSSPISSDVPASYLEYFQ